MLTKIRDKYYDFDYSNLNIFVVLLSFILFIISVYYLNNIYLIILLYLLLLYLSTKFYNGSIKFISILLPLIICGFIAINLIKFNIFRSETHTVFLLVIKILMIVDYFCIVIEFFKNKKLKQKRIVNQYTFKELRRKNINDAINYQKEYVSNYINENNIKDDSDYYKVITDNIENKAKNDLEEYVWVNYLRFYKNKGLQSKSEFDLFNIVFLFIHVIILLLILFVR